MDKAMNDGLRFIRLPTVIAMCGMSRTQIYKLMGEGRFPQSVQLSTRSVAWVESEVLDWMAQRMAAAA